MGHRTLAAAVRERRFALIFAAVNGKMKITED